VLVWVSAVYCEIECEPFTRYLTSDDLNMWRPGWSPLVLGLYLMRFDTPWLTDVFRIVIFYSALILWRVRGYQWKG